MEYDDSAFYYFCLALLSFYMVPGTYYFLAKQLWPALVPPKDDALRARTAVSGLGWVVRDVCRGIIVLLILLVGWSSID